MQIVCEALNYFSNFEKTILLQFTIAFCTGLFMGPFSWGIEWLIMFTIVYEIGLFYVSSHYEWTYKWEIRLGCNVLAIFGWILGRYLISGNTGLEKYAKPNYKKINV